MRVPHPFPEIYCDLNAEMIERGYSLERRGSVDDLAKLGLTLAQAVGMRFTFVMDDADEHGNPDDILFNGGISHMRTKMVCTGGPKSGRLQVTPTVRSSGPINRFAINVAA
jgi:hypothetical protein